MTRAHLLKQHREEIEAIVEAHRASNPRVFGSVRYGIDTPESDIDLIVDPDPGLSLFDLAGIQDALDELLGTPTHICTPEYLHERMRSRVLAEARAIIEGDYGYGGTAAMRDKSRRLPDYIEDILNEIDFVMSSTNGVSRAEFLRSGLLQRAVIRAIEVIGEASAKIRDHAPDFVEAHPGIPFDRACDIRNLLVHGYSDIDIIMVWTTATEDLPRLSELLQASAAPEAQSRD